MQLTWKLIKKKLTFYYKRTSMFIFGIGILVTITYLMNALFWDSMLVVSTSFIGFLSLCFRYYMIPGHLHLKNFSLLHLENGIAMSPAYDLLNVNLVFPKDQGEMALLFNGKKRNIKLRDFEALGVLLNIPEKVRHNTYRKFKSFNSEVQTLINSSFLSSEKKENIGKYGIKSSRSLNKIFKFPNQNNNHPPIPSLLTTRTLKALLITLFLPSNFPNLL